MHKEIQSYLSHLTPMLLTRGIDIYLQQEIAWGHQLKVRRGNDCATINIYYSEKKGISRVLSSVKDSSLKQELELLLLGEKEENAFAGFHNWHRWIGSDECGKGDYFGPLVTSAFYVSAEQVSALQALGVQDSKHLNDPRIVKIAKSIYLNFPNQAACIVLKPSKYNELIADFRMQKLNLNDLLAWLHERVIMELFAAHADAEGSVVDQFSRTQKVKNRINKKQPQLNVIERPSGERDIAVAAASILARYQFLEARAVLERRYKFSFPKGAGPSAVKAAREYLVQHPSGRLADVAKVHFKTTQSLLPDIFDDI
ncbi:MAG: ribonuclease HIII [Candidatus Cloacimonetes bacterium]|jgi:ribonuclease HIII|nr:ribonuclease HIII [Candidatus Cloacimonadota bacterium]MDD2505978.1 ribonuclease HIII [Candidatus Cloacimonadota bacterium]MDD4559266.1 ribonuclease HIII [Candidatus Cloacimonadota bacterium]